MTVTWAATEPSSGRFVPLEVTGGPTDLARRFELLRQHGAGYLEVRREHDYPVLTLGFADDDAVLHLFTDADTVRLLLNVQPARAEPAIVTVMDEPTEFTAEFIHRLDHAWSIVERFARTSHVPAMDQWQEL